MKAKVKRQKAKVKKRNLLSLLPFAFFLLPFSSARAQNIGNGGGARGVNLRQELWEGGSWNSRHVFRQE
jgi:hypothetical protein